MGIGMDRLAGKVAIVTGAGTGIGRATARLYAAEGAKVVVADIRSRDAEETVALIRSAAHEAVFVRTDVSSSNQVRALVARTEELYGALHVMTANAGILGRGAGKRLEEISEEEIQEIMAINFWGVCYCLKHAVPAIKRAGGGAITVTTSVAAHYGFPTMPAYAASKHAVVGLVQSLAADVGPTIRVNAVSAGRVLTEINAHTLEAKGLDPSSDGSAKAANGRAWDPKKDHFVAEPLRIAQAHLFLVSDEASFLNGQAIIADGGRTLVPAAPAWWSDSGSSQGDRERCVKP